MDGQKILIFLDLDGVIADFDMHADVHNKRLPDGKLDRESLDYEWWSSIPVFKGAHDFYDALRKIAHVKFLTGPMINPASHGGKAEWIRKFHPERGKWLLSDLIICPAKDKHLMAGPGRILIDDTKRNIDDWEAAGGIGIHHTGDFNQTLATLKKRLQSVKAPQPKPPRP